MEETLMQLLLLHEDFLHGATKLLVWSRHGGNPHVTKMGREDFLHGATTDHYIKMRLTAG